MIKLNILNMKNFLQTVNRCGGTVYLLHPDGRKENINKQYNTQSELLQKHQESKNYLPLTLETESSKDYMSIICYYIGDC